MAEIVIGEWAEAEYIESLLWYAERSRPAAEGFEAEFAQALEAIAAAPDRYPACDDRHRHYLLRRYPFHIIYRKASDNRLLIVAVAHTSRHPGYWLNR
jgi:plasmid stabilization system protein ParE